MSKILIFDVNETLLDLSPLKPHFKKVFDDADVMKNWFLTLLHSSLTVTLADDYKDFGALAGAALDSVAEIRKVSLEKDDRKAILETIKKLPPHKEVPESLERLRSNGFRLFTLTNSPPDTLKAQMENSGLTDYFEDIFSVDETRKFKPAAETYRSVAEKLGVKTSDMQMIAAHDWDIAGAINAGCRTAFVAREGKVYNSLYKKPDISGKDLSEDRRSDHRMSRELEIWRFAAERLKRDESVILLIVAESSGSSPGRQGFKMVVAAEEMCGSIGGGVMEVRLAELAKCKRQKEKGKIRSQISDQRFEIVEQVHRKRSPDSSGMICSGEQTVVFFELNSPDLVIVQKIIHALENHLPKTLQISNHEFQITETGDKNFDFLFERTKEPDALEAVSDRQTPHGSETDGQRPLLNERSVFLYQEKLGCKNKLFIIGGGHCALALSELMSKMDFHISLFDDRADLNTLAKNEFVHEKIIIDSYENIGEFVSDGNDVYVVVMTLGYKFDEVVIRQLFGKDFKYFGVLGSRAKMASMFKQLRKDGFDAEGLKKIRTPIGLPINSRTPEEIAVSIAAEIIAVKNRSETKISNLSNS